MRHFPTSIFLLICSLFSPSLASAKQEILAIALAPKIQNRQPLNPFTPPAQCEKDQTGQDSVPIIDVSSTEKVFFWTRIASTKWGKIRHSWHQQVNGRWQKPSFVDLRVRRSGNYRTWSAKTLIPQDHLGNWMIVVSPSDDPDHILCISRFIVK